MIGNKIKELRIDAGLKQTDLAKSLNLVGGTISSWELGINEPSIEMIVKLAALFDVSTDYLLGLEDIPLSEKEAKQSPFAINTHERELITLFRELNKEKQDSIIKLLK